MVRGAYPPGQMSERKGAVYWVGIQGPMGDQETLSVYLEPCTSWGLAWRGSAGTAS